MTLRTAVLLSLAGIVLGISGFVLHVYFTYLAYSESGFWASVLTFATFIAGDLYWAYHTQSTALGSAALVLFILFSIVKVLQPSEEQLAKLS